MDNDKLNEVTNHIQEKYKDIGLRSIEIDDNKGTSTFYLNPTKKSLAFLEKNAIVPRIYTEKGSTISRDFIDRTSLDLSKKDPYTDAPKELYRKAIKYYYMNPMVGTTTNILSSFAAKGFELDIDDTDIKHFFDVWNFDVNFEELIEWIFLDFFRVGHVVTYKVLSKYEPRVSYLSPIPGKKMKNKNNANKEVGAKKNIWSKGHLPVAYTVLNPLLVNIEGNLLFDKTNITLTPPDELKELIKKNPSDMTEEEKELIKRLPPDLKSASESGKPYRLDSRVVGSITYRKQPYERYAKPRITRIFDSLEYYSALRDADLSTLDGISNYILKITIGSDEYPVTQQAELEAVAELFNTSSKSFDVVWNHTLKIEKIVSPEIESILGKAKYEQVNDDITAGLGISRALIDGVGVQLGASEASLITKSIYEEISYARRQVTRWIYNEYRQIAEAMGFDRFPKIRWDEGVLKDTILYMNILAQLVDRRMLSYRTALEALNFDYPNELTNMTEEMELVQDGVFGIIGSPWQRAKVQPTQKTAEGTPSSGRPKGQTKTKEKETDPNKQSDNKIKKPVNETSTLESLVKEMSNDEFENFKQLLVDIRT
jgi:hypothetical protein